MHAIWRWISKHSGNLIWLMMQHIPPVAALVLRMNLDTMPPTWLKPCHKKDGLFLLLACLPANASATNAMRMNIKEIFARDMADILIKDIKNALKKTRLYLFSAVPYWWKSSSLDSHPIRKKAWLIWSLKLILHENKGEYWLNFTLLIFNRVIYVRLIRKLFQV